MYRVSVFGHRPEYIHDAATTKRLINRTLELLQYQYGEDLIVNAVGDIGTRI